MSDEVIALLEVVDALATTLARDRPNDKALASIAHRARKLYRKIVEDEHGSGELR